MTPEEREALREEARDERKRRRRAALARAWRRAVWVIAPVCAVWLVLLMILMIRERLFTRPGEWLVMALLALPALILLPLAAVTLVRGRGK